MLLAFFAGALLSLGHHLFYRSLDGRMVRNIDYRIGGAQLSQQRLNLAVGNTFAFLVKASLVAAVSLAYIQVFWRAARKSQKGITLVNYDAVYGAVESFWAILKVKAWWRFPLLLLLAVVAW